MGKLLAEERNNRVPAVLNHASQYLAARQKSVLLCTDSWKTVLPLSVSELPKQTHSVFLGKVIILLGSLPAGVREQISLCAALDNQVYEATGTKEGESQCGNTYAALR